MNPMANGSRQTVWNFLRQHNIPYHPLPDRGYHSIGCQPCTQAAAKAAHEQTGRWIGSNKVECGIQTFMPREVDLQI